ncbi:MAG: aspartate kinase [Nitrospinae bacterium]|nr:aspartate kinase [Nitrospinota bacterium]
MGLIVQKYGGTSVGDVERIKNVAKKVAQYKAQGHGLVVVLSAMSGKTDELIKLAYQITDEPSERELDMLISTGERITIPLLAMALQSLGLKAVSLTGRQSGIFTDSMYTKARITKIAKENVQKYLHDDYIVVVAGFQGVDESSNVTTLGRGGSDTTAVALAVALSADKCEIYTDVDGVYTTDPNVVPQARRIERISYEEMLEMASLGAKVLQTRSVEFAAKYRMPVVVKSTFKDGPGTWVVEEEADMEKVAVSSVVYDKNQAKLTVVGVPDKPGIAAKIFNAIARAEINVDMIIQNVSVTALTDLSLTVPRAEAGKAMKLLESAANEIEAKSVMIDEEIGKVSIVGVGMRSHTGVAAKFFSLMADANINIEMISTSEIKVSCVIRKGDVDRAVRILHAGFHLGGGEPRVEQAH